MAGQVLNEKDTLKAAKKELQEERKKLKQEQKEQKKLAKVRAKEIVAREDELEDDSESGGVSTFLVTIIIVAIWLGILCLLIKLDVGGFGSNVLAPILEEVPVVNMILPSKSAMHVENEESYMGYTNLKDAVEQIKVLEVELEKAQKGSSSYLEDITALKAEVERLKTFEASQVDFQKIKTQFYEEVVYAKEGPGAEAYKKYYESIDPTTAEYLYKQVVKQLEESNEIKDYAKAYSDMKPKEAAAIFEAMKDNLELASRILTTMSAEDRGKILGAMDPEVAAKLTKIMDPKS